MSCNMLVLVERCKSGSVPLVPSEKNTFRSRGDSVCQFKAGRKGIKIYSNSEKSNGLFHLTGIQSGKQLVDALDTMFRSLPRNTVWCDKSVTNDFILIVAYKRLDEEGTKIK